jgi:hypothetical protein
VNQRFALLTLCPDLLGQRFVVVRLEELEREIFELRFDAGHAEAVRQGRVDLTRLQRDRLAPVLGEVLQRPHVVEAVGQFHHDDPRIAGNREQELAVVLGLFLLGRSKRETGDLRQSVDDVADLLAELLPDLAEGDLGIFRHVVQQGCGDRHRVELLGDEDLGDLDRVGDEGLAGHALLTAVRGVAQLEGSLDQPHVQPIAALADGAREVGVDGLDWGGHSSPASAKLK